MALLGQAAALFSYALPIHLEVPMGPVLLATLVLLALAMPAAAQISAGPVGPLAMVDDNGKLLGGATPGDPFGDGWAVTLSTSHGSGFVYWGEFDGIVRFGTRTIYFTSSDCTGEGNTEVHDFPLFGIDGGSRLVVSSDSILYAEAGPATSVTVASFVASAGSCQTTSFTDNLYPVSEVGDLAAEFTPPFHVVTAASQMAALPIEIGWLVGGVLLGLGLKNTVKQR